MSTSDLYALVQHSGYATAASQAFVTRSSPAWSRRRRPSVWSRPVGVVFESWLGADFAEMITGYPTPELDTGIYPNAQGRFSTLEIDQLRVYVPCDLDWKNYRAEELAIWKTDEQIAREESRNGTDALAQLREGAL